jgi:hypothetical protein
MSILREEFWQIDSNIPANFHSPPTPHARGESSRPENPFKPIHSPIERRRHELSQTRPVAKKQALGEASGMTSGEHKYTADLEGTKIESTTTDNGQPLAVITRTEKDDKGNDVTIDWKVSDLSEWPIVRYERDLPPDQVAIDTAAAEALKRLRAHEHEHENEHEPKPSDE